MDNYLDLMQGFGIVGSGSLAVGISGGPDSMALALIAKEFARANNVKLTALIVDHKLRLESTTEALLVQQRLKSLGIDAHILTCNIKNPTSNTQEKARIARYELLKNYCKANDIKFLATAHHKDDQIETVLMRIFRGSGIDGISGMQSSSRLDDIILIRPLLDVTKAELAALLKCHDLEYVQDSSNLNQRYDRVKVRRILKQIPALWQERILLLAKNASRAKLALEKQAVDALTNMYISCNKYKLDAFLELPLEIALRVLFLIIKKHAKVTKPLRLKSLELLYCKLQKSQCKGTTIAGLLIKTKKGVMEINNEYYTR